MIWLDSKQIWYYVLVLVFNDNLENDYKFEKYEDKFGQFTKKM